MARMALTGSWKGGRGYRYRYVENGEERELPNFASMLGKAAAAAGKAAGKAAAVSADLAKAADDKLHIKDKVGSTTDRAKARVLSVPPEQRQKYLDTASTVLGTAALLGGPKVAAASCLVGAAASMHTSQVSAGSGACIVQVAATVNGGEDMTIALESGEMFQVTVPLGVTKGQLFELEVPGTAPPPTSARSGGLMAGASAAACSAAAASLSTAATSAACAAASKQVGLTPAQGKAGMQMAQMAGVTPTMAMQAAKDAKKAGLL